jgi:hypothetical protein
VSNKNREKGKYFEYALAAVDPNSYISLETFDVKDTTSGAEIYRGMPAEMTEFQNPEFLLLEAQTQANDKKLFEGLSQEAREIIKMLRDSPAEMAEMLSYRRQSKFSVKRLRKFLKACWGDEELVDATIEELATYAVKLEAQLI